MKPATVTTAFIQIHPATGEALTLIFSRKRNICLMVGGREVSTTIIEGAARRVFSEISHSLSCLERAPIYAMPVPPRGHWTVGAQTDIGAWRGGTSLDACAKHPLNRLLRVSQKVADRLNPSRYGRFARATRLLPALRSSIRAS